MEAVDVGARGFVGDGGVTVVAAQEQPVVLVSEEAALSSWERDRFARMGFDEARVELLVRERVSWHDLDDLLRQGCPPMLALSIVL